MRAGIKKKDVTRIFFQAGVLFLVYIAIILFLRNKLPDMSRIIAAAESVYGAYGYLLIFFGALIEGIFIMGFYIPGSLIVLLGVSLAKSGVTFFPLVIAVATSGFCLGYTINYVLGRFGWYKIIEGIGFEKQIDKTKRQLRLHYDKALFWGYIMPSTGAMISTVSGVIKVSFGEFIAKTFLIQIFWSLVIGGLAYVFGETFIHIFLIYFGMIVFFGIAMGVFHKWRKKTDSEPANTS